MMVLRYSWALSLGWALASDNLNALLRSSTARGLTLIPLRPPIPMGTDGSPLRSNQGTPQYRQMSLIASAYVSVIHASGMMTPIFAYGMSVRKRSNTVLYAPHRVVLPVSCLEPICSVVKSHPVV